MSNKLRKKSKPADHKLTGSSVRLSQCMIVKNEEENIEKALLWAKNIAFEQIVVDTGSTDRTVEIAEKMGAKIYHFEWINDFSAAKNYAIEQASGDWIAFLDADEYINEKESQALFDLLKLLKNRDANNKYANIIRLPIISINDDGSIISTHLQHRIFKNKKGIRFEGKIHENIVCKDPDDNVYVNTDEIRIWHTGYKGSVIEKKGRRNIPILEDIIKSDPDDYESISYLAEAFASKGDKTKAVAFYRDCINHIQNIKSSIRKYTVFQELIKLLINEEDSSFEDIEAMIKLFIEHYPKSPDPQYLIGCYEFKRKHHEEAALHFETALLLLSNYQDDYKPILPDSGEDEIRGFLAYSYFNLQKYEKALENFIVYLRTNKNDDKALISTLLIISRENLPKSKLLSYIKQILSGLYDLTSLKDVLICIKVCMTLGLNDITDWLKSRLNEEDKKWLES